MNLTKKMNILLSIFALTTIFLLPVDVFSAGIKPFDVKNDYFTLENGLKVVIKRDVKDRNISLTTAFKFGAAYDVKGKDGYANYTYTVVERMISKYFKDDYQKILNAEGAVYFPFFDRNTVSFTTIFAKEDLDTVLKIELQRMSINSIDQDEFDAVKRLKMSDFLKGINQQPEDIIKYNMNGVNHNFWEYYHRFEGKEKDIQVARIQDIERFTKWYYSPSNAAIVIKGPVDKTQLAAKIKEIFSTLPKSDVLPHDNLVFILSKDITHLQYQEPQMANPAISFSYRVPPVNHEDFPVVKIMYNLLFGGKESRFGKYSQASKILQDYYTAMTDSAGPNFMGAVFYIPDRVYFDSITDILNESRNEIMNGKFSDDEFVRARRRTQTENNELLSASNYTNTISKFLLIFSKPSDIGDWFDSFSTVTKQKFIEASKIYLADINSCIVYNIK